MCRTLIQIFNHFHSPLPPLQSPCLRRGIPRIILARFAYCERLIALGEAFHYAEDRQFSILGIDILASLCSRCLCLPRFHFNLSGKYFLTFLLAWIPFFPLRQVFPDFSTCLDASFPSLASISWLFYLPGCFLSHLRQLVLSWRYCPVYKKSFLAVDYGRNSLSELQIQRRDSNNPPPAHL